MWSDFWNYCRRNPPLLVGIFLLVALVLFTAIGSLTYDKEKYRPLSAMPGRPPAAEYPFGTDNQGRDLLAVMISGTPLTVYVGLLAGGLGIVIGTILAFTSAYFGGWFDALVKGVVDVGLTIPGLVILILFAVAFRGGLNVTQMALIVAALAWLGPTRTIRSEVLTMKERAWVQVARLSGTSSIGVIFKEMLPNLLPYLGASLVGSVTAAIFASIGLEALGLGPMDSPTLGMTIYWVIYYSALLHGMWWWFGPPIVIIVMLFVGLFNLSAGLDEVANPRLRRSV